MTIPKSFWQEHDQVKKIFHARISCAYLKAQEDLSRAADKVTRQRVVAHNDDIIAALTEQHKSEMRKLCERNGFIMEDYFKEA